MQVLQQPRSMYHMIALLIKELLRFIRESGFSLEDDKDKIALKIEERNEIRSLNLEIGKEIIDLELKSFFEEWNASEGKKCKVYSRKCQATSLEGGKG